MRPAGLDGTDVALLTELVADARITNAALAARVGIAESTCTARLRGLRESGVIQGFTARLHLGTLGLPIEAIVSVRLSSHDKDTVRSVRALLTQVPGVLTAFHVSGADDYMVYVAVPSPEALRELILDHLTVHPAIRHTETHLVFEVLTGRGPLAGAAPAPRPRGRAVP